MNLGPLACEAIASPRRVVLDMDSTEVRVHGRQEQSAYNGHFESTCYHPLLLFNREGDCLAAKLRPGNVHSADGWEELLLPEIERQQAQGKEVVFRGDAAFAKPELYEALEERDVKYAIRLPANDHLQRNVRELLTCLRNRLDKRHFWGLRGRETLNRPIPARLAAPWTKTGPKPCRGRPFGLYAELKSERQNGNSEQEEGHALNLHLPFDKPPGVGAKVQNIQTGNS